MLYLCNFKLDILLKGVLKTLLPMYMTNDFQNNAHAFLLLSSIFKL